MNDKNQKKGQFFIISAVIIASMLLMLSYNFSGFSDISLTGTAELSELEYMNMVKKTLTDAARTSECDRFEEDISAAEGFLSKKLTENGIELSVKHQTMSCKNVKFNFNISSQNFFSSTEFWYP